MTMGLGGFLEKRHLELAAEVEAYCLAELADLEPAEDDRSGRAQAVEILRSLGGAGWLAHAIPAQGRLDLRACCLIREALAASSPLADAVFALQCLGTQPIHIGDATAAHRDWLEAAATGRAMAAFAMTEEAAGSDVGGIRTRATKSPDGWVLDGGKRFISNAGLADFYLVFAVTDDTGERAALSCFLVPASTEGLDFVAAQEMSEPHPLGEIAFEGCRLPESALIGRQGEGFALGLATLDRLRASVAAAACGMAARALDEALAYAESRRQFGRPLAKFQLVQQKLAVMATELEAARLLTYRAAHAVDTGSSSVTMASAMAKWFATEAAQRIVDQAVQIHGGVGVLRDSTVDRLYRAVRSLRIYEGTTEIQQLIVARELQKRRDPS